MRVLVVGADGFIGRHLAFGLRAAGHEVLAHARDGRRLRAMGFAVVEADLTDPRVHQPAFWAGPEAVVYATGLLTGSEATFQAVHVKALKAVLAAVPRAVLVSAVGTGAQTPFARWRREGEAAALAAGAVVLRPGLVLADTSYGGSSALRAFAAMPFAVPVVGAGSQPFNPIHAADLAAVVAEVLQNSPGPGPWDIGGPEEVTQAELATMLRGWLGLAPAPVWRVPPRLAAVAGRAGDLLRLGPISTTALRQLEHGVLADPAPLLSRIETWPRGVSEFLNARPAGTQDLWQARLWPLKPLIRLALAVMWLVSAALGFLLPAAAFTQHLALPEALAVVMARAGGLADLALGIALLRDWRPRQVALAQMALVLGYTFGLTLVAPALWLDPFGGLLKNLPVLALVAVHLALAEER